MHHPKLSNRQDSSVSSDSYSMTSSPGYNTKSMEAPLLQHASKINKSVIRHQDSSDSFNMTSRYNVQGRVNVRQDSNVSSDSFSQTSSPGYNSKHMDAPLLNHAAIKFQSSKCTSKDYIWKTVNVHYIVASGIINSMPSSIHTN